MRGGIDQKYGDLSVSGGPDFRARIVFEPSTLSSDDVTDELGLESRWEALED
jgi:hypothetical protein